MCEVGPHCESYHRTYLTCMNYTLRVRPFYIYICYIICTQLGKRKSRFFKCFFFNALKKKNAKIRNSKMYVGF